MTHLIEDENLGGLLREYVETDRKADVGDYVYVQSCREIPEINERIGKCTNNGEFSDGSIDVDIPSEQYGEFSFLDGDDDVFITLDPTDIIHVEGARYKLVDRKAEVGEKVVIVNTLFDYGDAGTIGDVFTVEAVTNDCCYGDEEYLYGIYVIESDVVFLEREYRVLEPVNKAEIYVDGKKVAETPLHSEAIEVDESQASPEVIEMLGNLAQRIVKLESQVEGQALTIKRLEDEIDTLHSNQKRMAEELEANNYSIDEISGKLAHLEADVESQEDSAEVIVELAKLLVEKVREGGR